MFKSKFFTTALVVVIALLGLALIRVHQPTNNLNAEIKHANEKLIEAQRKSDELKQESSNLQNEFYIERQLRLKFNYKKPDEEAVLIYKTEPTVKQAENVNFFSKEYQKLSSWFKNLFD